MSSGVSSGLEDWGNGDTCLSQGVANATFSAATGAVFGPLGKIAVPMKPGTYRPDLWKPNGAPANPNGLGTNTKKWIKQEAVSSGSGSTVSRAGNSGGSCSGDHYLSSLPK